MRVLAMTVLCLAPAVAAAEPAPPEEGLRFAWPRPAVATVDLVLERRVGTATRSTAIRMRLEVVPEGPGDRLLIRLLEPRILAIDGISFARARKKTESADVAKVLLAVTPSFVVDGKGEFVENREVDRLVRDVMRAAGMPRFPHGEEVFQELVTWIAPSDWNAWVELWVGQALKPGEWERTERIVSFEGFLTPVITFRKGLESEDPARTKLRASAEYPSEAVRHFTVGLLLDMAIAAQELGDDVRANREFVEKARFSPMTETVTAELDTATLRPIAVERLRSFFAVGGNHRVEGFERRFHRFAWQDGPAEDE